MGTTDGKLRTELHLYLRTSTWSFAPVSLHPDGGQDAVNQRMQDDEVLGRVLEEGLRLRRKTKSLSKLLSDTEERRIAERELYQTTLKEKEEDFLQRLNELNAKYQVDLAAVRDAKANELNDVLVQLIHANNEIKRLNPLVETLQSKFDATEERLKSNDGAHAKQLHNLQSELTDAHSKYLELEKVANISMTHVEADRHKLTQRALCAECAVEVLQSSVTTLESEAMVLKNEHESSEMEAEEHQQQHVHRLASQLSDAKDQLDRMLLEKDRLEAHISAMNTRHQERLRALEDSHEDLLKQLADTTKQRHEEVRTAESLQGLAEHSEVEVQSDLAAFLETIREQQTLLQRSSEEIQILTKRMNELTAAKLGLERDVRTVIEENESLRRYIRKVSMRTDLADFADFADFTEFTGGRSGQSGLLRLSDFEPMDETPTMESEDFYDTATEDESGPRN